MDGDIRGARETRMKFLDKFGYPVETIEGRPVQNFIRRLIHTRKVQFREDCTCYPEHCTDGKHKHCWCEPKVIVMGSGNRVFVHQEEQ